MKKRSSLLSVVLFAGVVGFAFLAAPLLDRLFAPWVFEQTGRPALTGRWVGQLTTATGQAHGVLLELLLPEPQGRGGLVRDWESNPYGEIAGTARLCDSGGQVRRYTVEGEPEDRQAARITFYATPGETPAPDGLTVSWVTGAWDRAGNLTLTAQLYWRQGDSAISGPEYPDTQADATLPMTRGSDAEFEAICTRIRAAGL